VYEAGLWRGSVYLAMEYVQGVDLQQWLAAAPSAWREVAGGAAPGRREGCWRRTAVGLVHRDFKPSNVLVGDDGRVAGRRLRARRGGRGGHRGARGLVAVGPRRCSSTIAGAGALVGTPRTWPRAAPPRGGDRAQRSVRVSASPCTRRCTARSRSPRTRFAGLAGRRSSATPAAPPAHSPVPAWIHPLLLRGLAKDPARRFPSLAELLAELARDPEAERARRRRLALQLLATAALTVLVIVGGVIRLYARWSATPPSAAPTRASRQAARAARPPAPADDPAEADRLLAAFVDYPDNRGTAAVSRAYRERAAELSDPAAAVDAFAGAYLTATDEADEIAALRGLVPRLLAAGRHLEAGEPSSPSTAAPPSSPPTPSSPSPAAPPPSAAATSRPPAALDALAADDPTSVRTDMSSRTCPMRQS
jgi:hypothetical protein